MSKTLKRSCNGTKLPISFQKVSIELCVQSALDNYSVRGLIQDILQYESRVSGSNAPPKLLKATLDAVSGNPNVESNPVRDLRNLVVGGSAGLRTLKQLRVKDIVSSFQRCLSKPIAGSTLDVGCGTGNVALDLQEVFGCHYAWSLTDVADYRSPQALSMPFSVCPDSGRLPAGAKEFENVLLITVLHHCERPFELLEEAVRVSRNRIYIMESLIEENSQPALSSILGEDWREMEGFQNRFRNLNKRDQFLHAGFQDWFYNMVIQGDVSVPMKFATHRQWLRMFNMLKLKLVKATKLGYDQRTAPEFHVLYELKLASEGS